MTSARIPGDAWTWRGTALIVGVVLAPVLGLALGLSTQHDALLATERFDALIVGPAAMISAIACYAAWHVRPRPGLAWATIGLAVLGFQELARTTLLLVAPEHVTSIEVLEGDVVPVLLAVLAVAVGHHVSVWPDPAATGFGLGALMAAARLSGLDVSGDLEQHLPVWAISAVYVAVIAVLAAAVGWAHTRGRQGESVPRWARQRTALAIALIGGAHLALYLGDDPVARASVVVVGDTAGAVLLVSTFLALFMREVEAADRSHDELVDELARAVRLDQAHRARLHEVSSTIAGITSATELLRSTQEISEQRRMQMDGMVVAEIGRLERLMSQPLQHEVRTEGSGQDPTDSRPLDLDSVIGPIVLSHEARGQCIRWTASGLWVIAQPDAVAQVLNTLLDNAAEHAHSAVEVTAELQGDIVEVVVHDDGPGIDASLRSGLFGWGVRGPSSSGQGIGLYLARHLAQRQDGYLLVHDTQDAGATFVLGLPRHADGHAPGGRGEHSSLQPDPA